MRLIFQGQLVFQVEIVGIFNNKFWETVYDSIDGMCIEIRFNKGFTYTRNINIAKDYNYFTHLLVVRERHETYQ